MSLLCCLDPSAQLWIFAKAHIESEIIAFALRLQTLGRPLGVMTVSRGAAKRPELAEEVSSCLGSDSSLKQWYWEIFSNNQLRLPRSFPYMIVSNGASIKVSLETYLWQFYWMLFSVPCHHYQAYLNSWRLFTCISSFKEVLPLTPSSAFLTFASTLRCCSHTRLFVAPRFSYGKQDWTLPICSSQTSLTVCS